MNNVLQNKIYISTRPEGKSVELRQILQSHGAILLEMPMIEIQPLEITSEAKFKITHIDDYQWIVFTSANGIIHFFEYLKALSCKIDVEKTKIAVIGLRTAKELAKYGYTANYVNSGNTANDFADELKIAFGSSQPHVLLLVGNLAGTTVETELNSYATIHRINVYKTVLPSILHSKALEVILDNSYDLIIFTSPSAIVNFCQLTQGKLNINTLRIACIGTTTSGALLENGIHPLIVSKTMSSVGIANAIIEYYQKQYTSN